MINDNRKLILTDCDGVLLHWREGFDEWMRTVYKKIPQVKFNGGSVEDDYQIEGHVRNHLVEIFNASADVGNLSPWRDSVKYVKMLHENFGCRLRVITCIGTNKNTIRLREENLHRYFGPAIESVIALPIKDDKREALAQQKRGLIWIEDNMDNAILGSEMGFDTILMESPYNMPKFNMFDAHNDKALAKLKALNLEITQGNDVDFLESVPSWKQIYEKFI